MSNKNNFFLEIDQKHKNGILFTNFPPEKVRNENQEIVYFSTFSRPISQGEKVFLKILKIAEIKKK